MKKTLKVFLISIVLLISMVATTCVLAATKENIQFRDIVNKTERTIKIEINDTDKNYEYKVAKLSSEDEKIYSDIEDAKIAMQNYKEEEVEREIREINLKSLDARILEMLSKYDGTFQPVDQTTTKIPLPKHQLNRREVYLVVVKKIGTDTPLYSNKYTVIDNSVPVEGSISFTHYDVVLREGATYKVKIIGNNVKQSDYMWTSLNPEIATITDDGTIKGIKAGKGTIRVVGKKDQLGNILTVTVIPASDTTTQTSEEADKVAEDAKNDVTIGGDNSADYTPDDNQGQDIPINNSNNNSNNNTNNIVTENGNQTQNTEKDVPKGPIPQTGENITVLVLIVVVALGAGTFAIAKHSMKDVV